MRPTEIFVWETQRAIGYELRKKYHVYIGEAGWRQDGHAFLFINSTDYGGDFRISRDDYSFLTKQESFIGCTGIVVYPQDELRRYKITRCGQLREEHAQGLHEALSVSDSMEGWQITLCCNAIRPLIT